MGLRDWGSLWYRRQLYVTSVAQSHQFWSHRLFCRYTGFFFVVQSSQRQSIRALYSGDSVVSTVRRPGAHRAYLRDVSKQTTVMRLQGFLFFGTITHVEEAIRGLLDEPAWQRNPIRFLVLDLALVAGVDMSAAEAFVRVQRLLASKRVVLVLCGFTVESNVGRALNNVGLLEMPGVELFETFSGAIECESECACLFH